LPWLAAVAILSVSEGLSTTLFLLVTLTLWIYFLRRNLLDMTSILFEVIQKSVGTGQNR
jgi:hypothetical protein